MFNFNTNEQEIVIVVDVACLSRHFSLEDTMKYFKETGVLFIDTTNGGTPPYSITRTKLK